MPHNPIRVVVGPANYFSHPGSLNHLHDFFTDEQLSRAVWIYGERALAAAQTKLPSAFELPGAKHILFRGHCSESNVQQLAAESGDDRSVVIGVGGGALLDTAKALARRLGLPFVAVPTIAATCAAWTPLSVWYNDAGQALHYEIFDDANFMVLVEPEIILNAPQEYLLAGIGDTLAKWYEAVVLAPQPETLPLTVRLGINNAQVIRDALLNSSEQALADQQNQQLTQSFCDVVDAIIAGGGMVGGLGDRFTRVAAAHAVHNGLTVLPQTEKFLHGTKVAYGILVQSALLGQDDVLAQLTGAHQRFHLPTTLAELEVDINNQAEIDKVIAHTLRPAESIHYLPVTLTPDTLRAAFEKVESFKV
ncbi:hydroxycarboxylate dehydrogenase HcxA [Escherichia coli]|uniref:Oxidoreductase n=1 Tax=Escherichia coli TaxID=562 RepID=A0A2K3TPQ5_ECOLX|nr:MULTISPECIES: hydroxycarboxylate dehydrogenase HcxA [Escherichia]EGI0699004.1 hydroxycarboxylate dehydrogenase HcxA [Escherichia coli]EGI4721297.1 hydroxycarboxylate dehydrogenase HcxA [Escherichia coli]EGO6117609.1 hydroxycarboxylate dehydrogenase HcxA [Escherichia coli]EGO6709850.1 hydroxycarboxylate dehydrogenase HcxA [Escherichia coli]EGO6742696.1 hydroxycarboxylate dehydrogenase HcxA [Escherichia coli]